MTIQKNETYSAREVIALLGFKDMKTITRMLLEDKARAKPLLDAEIRGEGRMRRYYLKGSKVLAYLKAKNK